jgi:hypothetical protein
MSRNNITVPQYSALIKLHYWTGNLSETASKLSSALSVDELTTRFLDQIQIFSDTFQSFIQSTLAEEVK